MHRKKSTPSLSVVHQMSFSSARNWVLLVTAAILVFNLLFFYRYFSAVQNEDSESSLFGVWRFDFGHKFYVVDSQMISDPAFARVADKATDSPLSVQQVKKLLVEKIANDSSGKFQELEKEVHDKYADDYTEKLKKEIFSDLQEKTAKEYAPLVFKNRVPSYQVLDEQKSLYLKSNEEKILNGVVHDLLSDTTDDHLKNKIEALDLLIVDRSKYFQHVINDLIIKHAPSEPSLKEVSRGRSIGGNMVHELGLQYSRKFLTESRVKLSEQEFSELQNRHDEIVRDLTLMGVPPSEIYSGDGIVIVSNRVSVPAAVGLVVQLRDLKSELPVEVVINSEEDYNQKICDEILPKFNAKCKVIERELTAEIYGKLALRGFQLKMLAILVSSFDNTIVLDTDNWPVKSLDFLFTSEPFRETKFILWPDAWHKGASPLYYDIARFEIGEIVHRNGWKNEEPFSDYLTKNIDSEVLFHDLDGLPPFRGVESGQLVLSKREHFRSLYLAVYYNFYGPQFYYPLLYQGTYGSGDRETFVPALHVMKESYYLCEHDLKFVGVDRKKTTSDETYMDESTMVQRDPQQTFRYMKAWRSWLKAQNLDTRINMFQERSYTSYLRKKFLEETKTDVPEVLFMHVHDPKINALYNEQTDKTRFDYKSRYIREIGKHNDVLGNTDWELKFQTINKWVTCEALTDEAIWSSFEIDGKATCEKMKEFVKYLEESSNDREAGQIGVIMGEKG